MRDGLRIRPIAIGLLGLHLILRILFPEPNIFIDLILFNLVGILAALIALTAPIVTDRNAALSIGYAQLIWSFG